MLVSFAVLTASVYSDLNDPIPSLMNNLVNQGSIPGHSWGYTVGATYLETPVFGSLTLGGYDKARFNSSNMLRDITFGSDVSRDLVVDLDSITYDTLGAQPLQTQSIPIFIDSMVTQLWLPIAVCRNFETAFNLTWNDTASLYIIDDAVHATLAQQNPSFDFTLSGESPSGTSSITITIPYGAFDLNATAPLYPSGSRYFPLQRAQNATQYTLGRVFLQGAYVIADYDKQHFSIGQALFPSSSQDQIIVTIGGSPSLSKGATAGIAIGGVIVVVLLAVLIAWLMRKRRQRQQRGTSEVMPMATSAAEKRAVSDAPAEHYAGKHDSYELKGSPAPGYDQRESLLSELSADGRYQHRGSARYELAGTPVNEVQGSPAAHELRALGER